LKKKKKKKKQVEFEPTEETTEAPPPADAADAADAAPAVPALDGEDEDMMAMFAKKKKKKKKKTGDDGEEAAEPEKVLAETSVETPAAKEEEPEGEVEGEFDFGKKKRKKKRPELMVEEAEATVPELEDEHEGDGDEPEEEPEEEPEGENVFATEKDYDGKDPWLGSDRDYTYQELLGRVFRILRQNNPELSGEKRRYTIVPPVLHRDGSKKTVFSNVLEISKRMSRPPEHVISFLFTELGTTGSVDGEQRLVIKGRFQQKQIENVLRRYFVEYVTCKTCKSPETQLKKENRLFFIICDSCGSTRSVSAINRGFVAQTTKRSRRVAA